MVMALISVFVYYIIVKSRCVNHFLNGLQVKVFYNRICPQAQMRILDTHNVYDRLGRI